MSDNIPQTILNKARQDKFILVLDTPKVLKEYETDSARTNALLNRDKMQFSVIGVNLPTHTIPAVGVPFRGQTTHVTSQSRDEYPNVKVSFKVDNNWDNYWFIWKWMYILNNPRESGMDKYFAEFKTLKNNTLDAVRNAASNQIKKSDLKPITYKEIKMVHDYTDYQTIISLIGLREYNEKIIQFDYYNAFPVSLGEILYNYSETEEIACSFEFSYGQIDIKLIDPV
jgi:hypothetical protein